jgi:3-deoxy-manno-octulosonate cytidylyltransferase (CMP-KDO synthetase)
MRTIAVIPARFQSKRLPGKPLEDLHGKTMLQRVYERASLARRADEVLVATDDERIAETGASGAGSP